MKYSKVINILNDEIKWSKYLIKNSNKHIIVKCYTFQKKINSQKKKEDIKYNTCH